MIKENKMLNKNQLVGGPRTDYIIKNNIKLSIREIEGNTVFFTNETHPPLVYIYKGIANQMDYLSIAEEILSRKK
jgi:hypothetical protein